MTLEFTIEPFRESDLGPHVVAAIEAAEDDSSLTVDVGPFGTVVVGDQSEVLAVTQRILAAAFANGASRVSLQATASSKHKRT